MKENQTERVLLALAENCRRIVNQIPENQIAAYAALLKNLQTLDVGSNVDYQRTYSYFYRLRLRPADLKPFYFQMLNENKHRSDLRFEEVLEAIFSGYSQVHPSFSSKMVATVNPDKPVYDSQVLKLLGLQSNWQNRAPTVRMSNAITTYRAIESFYEEALHSRITDDLIAAFDTRFQSYTHFTRSKKLDLFLWQGGTFLSV